MHVQKSPNILQAGLLGSPPPLQGAVFVPICPEAELRHGLTWSTLQIAQRQFGIWCQRKESSVF